MSNATVGHMNANISSHHEGSMMTMQNQINVSSPINYSDDTIFGTS